MKTALSIFVILLYSQVSGQIVYNKDSLDKKNITNQHFDYQLNALNKNNTEKRKFRFSFGKSEKSIYRDNYTNRLYYQNGFDRTKLNTQK